MQRQVDQASLLEVAPAYLVQEPPALMLVHFASEAAQASSLVVAWLQAAALALDFAPAAQAS